MLSARHTTIRNGFRRARCTGLLHGLGLLFAAFGLIRHSTAAAVSSFGALYDLSSEVARSGQPVRIKGVVLCYDAGWGQLYIHDGEQTAYIAPGLVEAYPTVGQSVELHGTSTVLGGRPWMTNLNLTILGRADLPPPKRLEVGQLAKNSGSWIETSGRVRVAETSRDRLVLMLEDQGRDCLVYVMGMPGTNDAKALLDCSVTIRGVCGTLAAGGRSELALVIVAGINEVKVTGRPKEDPLAVPVTPIGGLLGRELGSWTNNRVHLNGSVVSLETGHWLVIKDPTGSIRAQVTQVTPVEPTARVDLYGFVRVLATEVVLANAYFEVPPAAPTSPGGLFPGGLAPVGTNEDQHVTRVSDVLRLDNRASARHLPVRFRAVVTYADTDWRTGFVQDSTGGIYFFLSQPEIRAGQWVEVTGQTDAGGFAPQLTNVVLRILGTTNLPPPVKVDLVGLASGSLDAQWVGMEGVIRQVDRQQNRLYLKLTTSKGGVKAMVPDVGDLPLPTNLVDARVEVLGACASDFNSKHQLTGITLLVPSLAQIKVLRTAETNALAVETMTISEVGTHDPTRPVGGRVRVTGTVSLTIPGEGFFIQDASGGMNVRSGQPNQLSVGDVVEVVGFPTLGDLLPYLEDASFRAVAKGRRPTPRLITAGEALLGATNNHTLVSIQARLVQDQPRSANPELILQDGPIIFTARLLAPPRIGQAPELKAGSLLRVAGVCVVKGNELHKPDNFRLLVADSKDVVLIKPPQWWTPRHALQIVVVLTLLVLGAAGWVALLRKQVREQTTKLLQATREAGMSEVATAVLHNVGNVLTSVNVSATLIGDRLQQSRLTTLTRVVEVLRQHEHDLVGFLTADARGKQLPNLLKELNDHLLREQQELLGEADSLRRNVDHIRDVVSVQQRYAIIAGVTQLVKVPDLIEDTLRMNASALSLRQIRVQREFAPDLPEVNVDKHKVLQILVNLVRNAKSACDESGRDDKQLTLRAIHNNGLIEISVVDNGVGIPPENITLIFNHGFTTRKDGHGFGLHSGALAARELGGSLVAFSDGPGQGATFTLTLPLQPPNSRS